MLSFCSGAFWSFLEPDEEDDDDDDEVETDEDEEEVEVLVPEGCDQHQQQQMTSSSAAVLLRGVASGVVANRSGSPVVNYVNGELKVVLTDPDVLDCLICLNPLSTPGLRRHTVVVLLHNHYLRFLFDSPPITFSALINWRSHRLLLIGE
ncbi:hypothetical protein Hdeb2414_s0003g00102771 [Helianthus debilis subsp. tardiflorus]